MLKWVIPFIWEALRVLAFVLQLVGFMILLACILIGVWVLADHINQM